MTGDIPQEPCSSSAQDNRVLRSSALTFDEQSKSELLTHVQLLLSSFGLNKSADSLSQEIEQMGLIPVRYNFDGVPCRQSFSDYLGKVGPFSGNLVDMLKRLEELNAQNIPPVIQNLPIRLFTSKRQSLSRRNDVLKDVPRIDQIICRQPVISAMEKAHSTRLLMAREYGSQSPLPSRILLRKESLNNLELHSRILGHLGPIFCVKFDVTGRYIFTGADDNLIKVWDARSCLLRYTFRGHTSYIMDMAISPENTMLASGSMDKTVRVWCLQRGKTLMVYKGHTACINTISFIPYMKGNTRYLVSAGNDCTVAFFKYETPNNFMLNQPICFNERMKTGARLITLCHSPGGNLVAIGDSHQFIRIFQISENNVERLFQIPAHSDRVDSLIWAHKALRFVSGSKDGVAKVWNIGEKGWCSSTLKVPRTAVHTNNVKSSPPPVANYQRFVPNGLGNYVMQMVGVSGGVHSQLQAKKNVYRVTMLCWSLDDDIVVSSGSDNLLRTWNWRTGEMLRVLTGHTAESFMLLAHPIYREIVVSVGHDAMMMIWNIYDGKCIRTHRNDEANRERRAIFDMAISPDGTLVSFVDNYGHLSILGVNSNERGALMPREQFFQSDYRPLAMDASGYVLDELTGLAPHNMDPPIFVNSEGAPYKEELQRLVPGKDLLDAGLDTICPWVTRQIVPALTEFEHANVLAEWKMVSEFELGEIDRTPNTFQFNEINPENRHLVPRQRKARTSRDSAVERRAHIEQMTNSLLYPPEGVPRYVIGDEDDSDEDDSSYTAGEDAESLHSANSVNTRSSGHTNLDEDALHEDWNSEMEELNNSAIPASSMMLRNGRRRTRYHIDDDDEDEYHNADNGMRNSQRQPTSSSDVLRRNGRPLRQAARNAGFYDETPTATTSASGRNSSETAVSAANEAPRTTRRGRKPRVDNNRTTPKPTSSSAELDDQPCCSRSGPKTVESDVSDSSPVPSGRRRQTNENQISSDSEFDEVLKIVHESAIDEESGGNPAVVSTNVVGDEEETSAGEECHESDNTYKYDSGEGPSSSRPQRNVRRRVCFSPSAEENFSGGEHRAYSSSASSPSSSSVYSSGKKSTRKQKTRRQVSVYKRNGMKRKAPARKNEDATSSAEAKRPRRAAADNARCRFRESSESANDENTSRMTTTALANDNDDKIEYEFAVEEVEVDEEWKGEALSEASNDDDAFGDNLPSSSNSAPHPTQSRNESRALRLPKKTRTGRSVKRNSRYCDE